MTRFFGIAVFGAIAANAAAASTYSWTDITPKDESVVNLVVHPIDGKRLLAVTDYRGLRSSRDGGLTWTATTTPGSPNDIYRVFAHPGQQGVVFLQHEGYLYTPALGDTISYAGLTFRSDDFGDTWTGLQQPTPAQGTISPFASDPLDVNHIYATRRAPRTFARMFGGMTTGSDFTVVDSHDGGRTWSEPPPTLPAYGGIPIGAYDNPAGPTPAAPRRLFFTTQPSLAVTQTYVSTDSGATWNQFSYAPPGAKWIQQDPKDADVLYALRQHDSSADFMRSDSNGLSWSTIFTANQSGESFFSDFGPMTTIDPVDSRKIWLTGLADGVFHSDDGGRTWTADGFAADTYTLPWIVGPIADDSTRARAAVVDAADPGVVFILRAGRLFRGVPSSRPNPAIVEFHYEEDRYWSAVSAGEALSQDYRQEPGHVWRTGLRWGAWRADDAPAGAVGSCRFWPQPSIGRSRVIVQQGADCDALKRDPGWILEAENEFFTMRPVNDACPANTVPVRRFLNLQPDFNHRWVADPSLFDQMRITRGWYDEGVRFCARPLGPNE